MTHGPVPCAVCGQVFEKRSHNSLVCSDACRAVMYKARWNKNTLSSKIPSIISTCEVCKCEFIGRNRLQTYRACDDPKCRLEVRRRAGRITADKLKGKGLMRSCLKCSKEFKAAGKFNRICPECKGNFQANPVYANVWGKVI